MAEVLINHGQPVAAKEVVPPVTTGEFARTSAEAVSAAEALVSPRQVEAPQGLSDESLRGAVSRPVTHAAHERAVTAQTEQRAMEINQTLETQRAMQTQERAGLTAEQNAKTLENLPKQTPSVGEERLRAAAALGGRRVEGRNLAARQQEALAQQIPNPEQALQQSKIDKIINFVNSLTKPWTDEFGQPHTVRRYEAVASDDKKEVIVYAWDPLKNARLGNDHVSTEQFNQELKEFGELETLQRILREPSTSEQLPKPVLTSEVTRGLWAKTKELFAGAGKKIQDKAKSIVNASIGANRGLAVATLEQVQAAMKTRETQAGPVWKQSDEQLAAEDEHLRKELKEAGVEFEKPVIVEILAVKTGRVEKATSWWSRLAGAKKSNEVK